jgi:hypothetical protein
MIIGNVEMFDGTDRKAAGADRKAPDRPLHERRGVAPLAIVEDRRSAP